MDEKETSSKVIAFDTLFTTNKIQILKVLMTYLDASAQKQIAIYIKLSELQYTMDFFHKHPYAGISSLTDSSAPDAGKLFDEILPLCSQEETSRILQFKNTYQNLQQMQETMEMLQMMKDIFPEAASPFDSDLSDIMNLFHTFNNQENGGN